MGECQCSNIAIMQLFHELKQQFPALPDQVVSQCIVQNSYNREICTKSLRESQELRPSPGAFPPPAPQDTVLPSPRRGNGTPRIIRLDHCHQNKKKNNPLNQNYRAHRPTSLDIAPSRQISSSNSSISSRSIPFSAPPTYKPQIFFHNNHQPSSFPIRKSSTPVKKFQANNTKISIDKQTSGNIVTKDNDKINFDSTTAGFELNVNVACSPVGNNDFHTIKKQSSTIKCSETNKSPHYNNNKKLSSNDLGCNEHNTRSYTSVSLTLRPPSSDPQAPIDIRSQGSSLTYSSSSLDPRGFESRLQISISPGNVAKIIPTMANIRPNSLIPVLQTGGQRSSGLSTSQLTTMSAPTTPSAPTKHFTSTNSLPTTPSVQSVLAPPESTWNLQDTKENYQHQSVLRQVSEEKREFVLQQLIRKDRLSKELEAEKVRLETMKKELRSLSEAMKREQRLKDPLDRPTSPELIKKRLESEIYQLQEECKILTAKVDIRSDPRVPLGETNEEFYQGIYTGQTLNIPTIVPSVPPPLPSEPPAWQVPSHNERIQSSQDNDGPSWVCRMCTFDNHPLMDSCEQCDMQRFPVHDTGTTNTSNTTSTAFPPDRFKQTTSRV